MENMDEKTQIAVMQNDISHMKSVLDEIKGDLKEMKGAYVSHLQYSQDIRAQETKNDKFITIEQFNDKFNPYQKSTIFIGGAIIIQFISIIFQYFSNL